MDISCPIPLQKKGLLRVYDFGQIYVPPPLGHTGRLGGWGSSSKAYVFIILEGWEGGGFLGCRGSNFCSDTHRIEIYPKPKRNKTKKDTKLKNEYFLYVLHSMNGKNVEQNSKKYKHSSNILNSVKSELTLAMLKY